MTSYVEETQPSRSRARAPTKSRKRVKGSRRSRSRGESRRIQNLRKTLEGLNSQPMGSKSEGKDEGTPHLTVCSFLWYHLEAAKKEQADVVALVSKLVKSLVQDELNPPAKLPEEVSWTDVLKAFVEATPVVVVSTMPESLAGFFGHAPRKCPEHEKKEILDSLVDRNETGVVLSYAELHHRMDPQVAEFVQQCMYSKVPPVPFKATVTCESVVPDSDSEDEMYMVQRPKQSNFLRRVNSFLDLNNLTSIVNRSPYTPRSMPYTPETRKARTNDLLFNACGKLQDWNTYETLKSCLFLGWVPPGVLDSLFRGMKAVLTG